MSKSQNNLRIYGFGGAGISLGARVRSALRDGAPEIEKKISFSWGDTSTSDLSSLDGPDVDTPYIVDGMEGKGKIRISSDIQKIVDAVPDMLSTSPPAKFNICIHSSSGGSGSTLGALSVNSILEQGSVVVVVMVGGTESEIEIKNTRDVFLGYSNTAREKGVTLLGAFFENNNESPEKDTDTRVAEYIIMLTMLFSGRVSKLDFSDVKNMFYLSDTSGVSPAFSSLQIQRTGYSSDSKLPRLACISLENKSNGNDVVPVESDPSKIPLYHTRGYISKSLQNEYKIEGIDMSPLCYVVNGVAFQEIEKRYSKSLQAIAEKKRISKNKAKTLEEKESKAAIDPVSGLVG